MLKFQRAFLAEIAVVFGAVLAVTTAIVFAGFALYLVTDGEEAVTEFVMELLPDLVPWSAVYALPFAWLVAVAVVTRRMAAENEVTALRCAGSHLRVLVLPMAAFGCVLGVVGMGFNGWVVPKAQRHIKQGLMRHLPAFLENLRDANRTVVLGEGRFSYGRFADGVFHDVELDQRATDGTLRRKFVARTARIRRVELPDSGEGTLEFLFEDAHIFDMELGGDPDHRYQRPETTVQTAHVNEIGGSTLFNEFFATRRYLLRPKEMTVSELLYAATRGGVWRGVPREIHLQLHGRLSLGSSAFALGLLAMALALVLPASGGRVRDFVLCFLPPVFVYFGLFLLGPPLTHAGVPPWLAMWAPNLVVGTAGLALFAVAFRR